ncbi:MDR family MFS transporter [Vibrio splendidus]|uniref:MDR family MFS transporter n=1 Tax=Vibrio TaxID=662 RepID=UPI0009782EDD|nr:MULTISPECIES: MFS transporter [Vibrio]OMO31071.1 MFS transporter [Vibrio splendidus]PMG36756.1 MFS transporter [Vibrio splendidus]PMI84010.1 MFS transporter [Vibrio splendidus]PMK13510.1 MFS transporter [Vibrio splendidus]PMK58028.1 MFS transporter [Vibrio splendidus]|tara:strand:- start:529 stop:1773 length:1245 start_codon:yes stop_codon:yes gene_type:complete
MEQPESLFQKQRVKRFNFSIWTVLTGTLLARTSYFMAWPFLIVFLYEDYGASAIEVGMMLATSAVVGAGAGLYSGYISDKLGRKWVMVLGSWVAAIAYSGIGIANEIWQFYVLIMMTGLMRPMIEAPAKAVIGDNLDDLKDRELALNVRYFLLNLGGALGPLIGITLALAHPQNLFFVAGFTYVVYGFWLLVGIERKGTFTKPDTSQLPNFTATLSVIRKDNIFVKLMIANFIMMFVYAQVESSIPQVIVRSSISDAAHLIASLVLVNTLTIIVFQFPMLKWLEHVPLFVRTRIGMSLMALAQVGFLFTPSDWALGWGMACFILSLGEVIAFPTLNVQIDRMAPPHLRGSYFGAAALYSLGFAIAPLMGGVVIELLSPAWLFAVCFGLCLVMIWLYWLAEHTEDTVERAPITQN